MKGFIELHEAKNVPILVNVNSIAFVADKRMCLFSRQWMSVEESYEEIVEKIRRATE